jgi:hypothetical protein
MQTAGWKHPAIIYGGVTLGICCILAAGLSPWLPRIAQIMAAIAQSPSSWFTLAIFMMMVAWFAFYKPARPNEPSSPSASSAPAAREMRAFESKLTTRMDSLADALAQLQQDTHIDYPNASTVAQAFQNLDDAVHGKTRRIEERVESYAEQLKALSLDSAHLLNFSVDVTTLRFLERIDKESPLYRNDSRMIDDYPDDAARETARTSMERYVRDVRGWFAGTHRGMMANNVIANAEGEAERKLEATPPESRPAGIDPLQWRRYVIAETSCMRAGAFILQQRDEVAARLTGLRDGLLDRYTLRNPQ